MPLDIDNVIGSADDKENGVWVKFEGDVEFLLVYSESTKPRNFSTHGMNRLRRKSRNGEVAVEKQQKLHMDNLVTNIVKGWKGLTQKDPTDPEADPKKKRQIPFEYSAENCRRLLESSPMIRDFVSVECVDIENFGGNISADGTGEEGESGKAALKSGVEMAT